VYVDAAAKLRGARATMIIATLHRLIKRPYVTRARARARFTPVFVAISVIGGFR